MKRKMKLDDRGPTRRALLALPLAARLAPAWQGYRGDDRRGVSDERIGRWSEQGPALLWRRPIGPGYASVAVGGGRGYSADFRDGDQTVFAFDLETGRELWAYRWKDRGRGFRRGLVSAVVRSGKGPRATPSWDAGVVYAAGPAGQVVALDADRGKPLWRRDLVAELDAKSALHGVAPSPLVLDDVVVLAPGRAEPGAVVALDRKTGALRWGALGDDGAYVSPMLATLAGRRQIVAGTQRRAAGLDPADGALLWDFAWKSGDWAAQPLPLSDGGLLLTGDSECARIDLVAADDRIEARERWRNILLRPGYSSPVTDGRFLYGLDKSFLACLDPETGRRRWKGGRYGSGQLLLAGDELIVVSENGELARIEATPEAHNETARFPAVEGPVFAGGEAGEGRLFLRGDAELACFQAG